jgi:hypothetical protein
VPSVECQRYSSAPLAVLTRFPDDDLAQLVLFQVGQHGSAIGTQQVLLLEQVDLLLHGLRADKTLSGVHVKVDVQSGVHFLEFLDGKVTESLPETECGLVAVLHKLEECSRFVVNRWVGFSVGIDFDVDLNGVSYESSGASRGTHIVQMLDGIRLELLFRSVLFETQCQQSKLLAPVSQVVYTDDFPSVGLVQVGEEGADNSRSQMTRMERLGDVDG